LDNIDWLALNQIPEGARVFIGGFWYRKLFPFFAERKIKAIMRLDQYGHLEYPQFFDYCLKGNWYNLGTDRLNATEQAVQYLLGLGRRRVGMIKLYKNEPLHPYRLGMTSAYEKFGIEFKDELYCETNRIYDNIPIENEIIDFWKRSKFDALVIGHADMFKYVYNTLTTKLGLRIPDDVALMSFTDHPDYLEAEIPVSAIDFPWVSMGQELVKCFNREQFTPGETVFNASIIERESTRKGAGAFINHNFMPELPVESNAGSYQIAT
jgi:DNA-binding LacI/PurR family transcriptional regulator